MSEPRAVQWAHLYLQDGADMRSVAATLGASEFTVHRDLTKKLPAVDAELAARVRVKIERQLKERAARGGKATRGVARWRGWGREGRVITGDRRGEALPRLQRDCRLRENH